MKTDGVILDTGPLVAYLDADDALHDWAVEQFGQLSGEVVTCEAVLTETAHLLRHHPAAQRTPCEMVETGAIQLGLALKAETGPVLALMEAYEDHPMSLADACVVRLAELWRNFTVLTTDRHFRSYRKHRRQIIPSILPPGR